MHTEWQLNELYGYTSVEDAALEADTRATEKACEAFEKKYRADSSYLSDAAALGKALKDYEKIYALLDTTKPLRYCYFLCDLNSADTAALAKKRTLEERFTKAALKTNFFTLTLGKVPTARQKKFLAAPELKRHTFFLERLFLEASHTLSEAEEKILALKNAPARAMWVDGVDGAVNRSEVAFGGKKIPFNKALGDIRKEKDVKKRRALHDACMAQLKTFSDFAESEINAVYTNKKINDELRGYKEPYSATIEGYQNEEASVLALVEAVTQNFHLGHRFYAIKKKIMGLPYLTSADRNADIGSTKASFPFPKAFEIVRDSFAAADPKYAAVLDAYLAKGQIDVAPKKGKTGGAYCAAAWGHETQVLLNHVETMNSVRTLGHEMGHAVHFERSKESQSPLVWGCSTSTAETASTFFEGLTRESVVAHLSEKERFIALHDAVQDAVATILRQVACFNFELELHRTVRESGWVPAPAIATMMNRHMSAYMGKAVKLSEDDGYFFVAWSHIRNPFYVYSYAYGDIISRVLREKVKENPAYIKHVDKFLSAGGSATPEDIFASIGIDVRGPAIFTEGLKALERDIDELERLAKKWGK